MFSAYQILDFGGIEINTPSQCVGVKRILEQALQNSVFVHVQGINGLSGFVVSVTPTDEVTADYVDNDEGVTELVETTTRNYTMIGGGYTLYVNDDETVTINVSQTDDALSARVTGVEAEIVDTNAHVDALEAELNRVELIANLGSKNIGIVPADTVSDSYVDINYLSYTMPDITDYFQSNGSKLWLEGTILWKRTSGGTFTEGGHFATPIMYASADVFRTANIMVPSYEASSLDYFELIRVLAPTAGGAPTAFTWRVHTRQAVTEEITIRINNLRIVRK